MHQHYFMFLLLLTAQTTTIITSEPHPTQKTFVSKAQQTDPPEVETDRRTARVEFRLPTASADQPLQLQHANKPSHTKTESFAAPLSPDNEKALLMRENKRLKVLVKTLQQRLAVQSGL